MWDGDECNRLRGTDSTIFPPFLKPDDGLWTYTPDICMSLKAHYVRKSTYAGLPTSLYSINFGNFEVSCTTLEMTTNENKLQRAIYLKGWWEDAVLLWWNLSTKGNNWLAALFGISNFWYKGLLLNINLLLTLLSFTGSKVLH